ncbi:LamG-like jellyroll fold domain-containing protein [Mycobacterium heidelbergense]|uniref:LamG-like jellyroll fold domain-containing protein n=1 Tax=Mycobacterium heidelbergense TaxID=53376 RepID=UPI003CF6ECB2
MAELWELILHHSYTGAPGVVFDQSPRRGSHGVAVHIPDGDFLRDGASEGSGAVVTHRSPNSHIDVPVTSVWRPMSGVRVEVVCICDEFSGGPLIGSDCFGLSLFDGDMAAGFSVASGGGGGYKTGDAGDVVPVGEWITVGYTYDGVARAEFTLNGATIREFKTFGYLAPAGQRVTIGNRRAPGGVYDRPFAGRIDDVKVWRVNPHHINDDFTSRPVDDSVARCWADWFRKLKEVMRGEPECAAVFISLLKAAMESSKNTLVQHGVFNSPEWVQSGDRYAQLWSEGRIREIPSVMADFLAFLRRLGIDPTDNDEVRALLGDPCVQRILDKLPPIDCDPDFTDYLIGGVTF